MKAVQPMASAIKRASLTLAVALALNAAPALLSAVGISFAGGAAEAQEKKEEKTKKTQAMTEATYKVLTEAQKLADENKFAQAKSALDALKGKTAKMNSYEVASMWNFYAYIYYAQENYNGAIDAYKKVLAQPDIPDALANGTKYSLAQLLMVQERYGEGLAMLNEWLKVAQNPGPEPFILAAQAYYQNKQMGKALEFANRAFDIAKQQGKEPKENWYLLLRVLYYEKGDMKKVAEIVNFLVRKWPKKEYILQLAGIYGELEKTRDQMVVMETGYRAGWLQSEQELLNMAYLYMGNEVPWKAAQVLEKAMKENKVAATQKNLEVLASALSAAQEHKRAIPVLERAAAAGGSGDVYAKLADMYLNDNQNAKAVEAANKALNAGGGKRADLVRITKCMALYNMDKLHDALDACRAAGADPRSAKASEQWQKFLGTEITRKEELEKSIKELQQANQAPAEKQG